MYPRYIYTLDMLIDSLDVVTLPTTHDGVIWSFIYTFTMVKESVITLMYCIVLILDIDQLDTLGVTY